VAGDPIEIEITFRHPHTDQPIRISGTVGIHPEETHPAVPSQTDPGLLDRLQRIREWERKNLPQWGSRIAQDLFRYLGAHAEKHHASTVKEIVLATGYSERAIRKQLHRFGEHGWITRTQSDVDRRNAYIQSTERFRVDYAYWLMLHHEAKS
jgi:DNA-binding MarR family transcriptional regulator